LIGRYQAQVAGLVRALVSDRDACEDLCQATFVKMVMGLRGLREGQAFEPWLLQIARNACRDHLRRERWKRRLLEPFEGRHNEVAEVVTPDLGVDRGDLERALARLDPPERSLVNLTLDQKRSYAEVAALLGVSISATRSRLFRVRQRLGVLMKEGRYADEN
jgi:RNA polymerase sigma-70 factor (ECF subfamily)